MGAAEMLHQVSLLPKPVKTQYAFVRSDPGMRAQMHINVGLRAQQDPANRALALFPGFHTQIEE